MKAVWQAYAPRSIVPRGARELAGWRMKTYEVNAAPAGANWADYAGGLALAEQILPQPPATAGRVGLGFLIAHPCPTHFYLIVNWWDNQNELFTRVFVTERNPGAGWLPAGERYSYCVWDLEILWFERNAWIKAMLSGDKPQPERYESEQLRL